MNGGAAGRHAWRTACAVFLRDPVLWTLVAVFIILSAVAPARIPHYPQLIDWNTVMALAGLLILARGIEISGYLQRIARLLIARLHTQRMLAGFLVAASALLAMVLTNDIALFVIVPLTVGLRRIASVPVARLVVFEALAVNAGSLLTPIGNPQNLFLWRIANVPFFVFMRDMLPLFFTVAVLLAILTVAVFPALRITLTPRVDEAPRCRSLLLISAGLFVPFIVLVQLHATALALVCVGVLFVIAERRVLRRVDWTLILVFGLMFIDLRLIADLGAVRTLMAHLPLGNPHALFATGVVASQFISNVPAAILLAEYSQNWHLIAYGVNVGGFGFVAGSLANIIALRIAGEAGMLRVFHRFSLPFLAATCVLTAVWLFWI
jgi:Na+/H+ antiporter NhaD/arsenite permease-like protein